MSHLDKVMQKLDHIENMMNLIEDDAPAYRASGAPSGTDSVLDSIKKRKENLKALSDAKAKTNVQNAAVAGRQVNTGGNEYLESLRKVSMAQSPILPPPFDREKVAGKTFLNFRMFHKNTSPVDPVDMTSNDEIAGGLDTHKATFEKSPLEDFEKYSLNAAEFNRGKADAVSNVHPILVDILDPTKDPDNYQPCLETYGDLEVFCLLGLQCVKKSASSYNAAFDKNGYTYANGKSTENAKRVKAIRKAFQNYQARYCKENGLDIADDNVNSDTRYLYLNFLYDFLFGEDSSSDAVAHATEASKAAPGGTPSVARQPSAPAPPSVARQLSDQTKQRFSAGLQQAQGQRPIADLNKSAQKTAMASQVDAARAAAASAAAAEKVPSMLDRAKGALDFGEGGDARREEIAKRDAEARRAAEAAEKAKERAAAEAERAKTMANANAAAARSRRDRKQPDRLTYRDEDSSEFASDTDDELEMVYRGDNIFKARIQNPYFLLYLSKTAPCYSGKFIVDLLQKEDTKAYFSIHLLYLYSRYVEFDKIKNPDSLLKSYHDVKRPDLDSKVLIFMDQDEDNTCNIQSNTVAGQTLKLLGFECNDKGVFMAVEGLGAEKRNIQLKKYYRDHFFVDTSETNKPKRQAMFKWLHKIIMEAMSNDPLLSDHAKKFLKAARLRAFTSNNVAANLGFFVYINGLLAPAVTLDEQDDTVVSDPEKVYFVGPSNPDFNRLMKMKFTNNEVFVNSRFQFVSKDDIKTMDAKEKVFYSLGEGFYSTDDKRKMDFLQTRLSR